MADLGTDISSYPDYDPIGTLVSGTVGLCQRVAKRLTNPRGAWFWALNECTDVRALALEALTRDRQASLKSTIEREVQREEGVLNSRADITISQLSTLGQVITIHVSGSTSEGPFKFVLNITAVTVDILNSG